MAEDCTALVPITAERISTLEKLSNNYAQALVMGGQKPADVFVKMCLGEALGFDPRVAPQMFHVIEGRPCPTASAMLALVLRSPHCEDVRWEEGDGFCRCTMKRRGIASSYTAEWTMAKAQRAGLTGRPWQKTPEAMLRARVGVDAARALFPDVLAGLYSSEEMRDAEPAGDEQAFVPQEAHVTVTVANGEPTPDPGPNSRELLEAIKQLAATPVGKTLQENLAALSEGEGHPVARMSRWSAAGRGLVEEAISEARTALALAGSQEQTEAAEAAGTEE